MADVDKLFVGGDDLAAGRPGVLTARLKAMCPCRFKARASGEKPRLMLRDPGQCEDYRFLGVGRAERFPNAAPSPP